MRRRATGEPRRHVGAAILVVLALAVALTAVTAVAALPAGAGLLAGRQDLARGRSALLAGQPRQATAAFGKAAGAFRRSSGAFDGPLLRGAATIPLAGHTVRTAHRLSAAGLLLARAGRGLSGTLASNPAGLAALAPRRGHVAVDPLRRATGGLRHAERLVGLARRGMAAAPTTFVLDPVDEARESLHEQLDALGRSLAGAVALSRELPGFLGASGSRRYFVGAQNPAELRGTGGLLSAYGVLTADHGDLDLSDLQSITALPSLDPGAVPSPNASYRRRYERYGGAGFWPNINMTPDFPSAAAAMERLFELGGVGEVDGAIVADPFALAALLNVTGPVTVPGVGSVDAAGVVEFVTNDAYTRFGQPHRRRRLLADVATTVVRTFLREAGRRPAQAARALVGAAAGGHVLLHSERAGEQAAFETADVAGRLADPAGDHLAVVANNAAANKADFFLRPAVRHEISLLPGGAARAVTTVTMANDAPSRGEPAYVIGPNTNRLRPGDNETLLSVYRPDSTVLTRVTRDGAPTAVAAEPELGHTVYTARVRIPAGGSTRLSYATRSAGVWTGDGAGGSYRLTVQSQPTLNPVRLRVDVAVPDGMRVVEMDPDMATTDGGLTWSGQAGDPTTVSVRFRRPPLALAWHRVWRFLNRPLLSTDQPDASGE